MDAALATEIATTEDAVVVFVTTDDVTAFVCSVVEAELLYTADDDTLLLAPVACTEALLDLVMVICVVQLLALDANAVGAMTEALLDLEMVI